MNLNLNSQVSHVKCGLAVFIMILWLLDLQMLVSVLLHRPNMSIVVLLLIHSSAGLGRVGFFKVCFPVTGEASGTDVVHMLRT